MQHLQMCLPRARVQPVSSLSLKMISGVRKMTLEPDPEAAPCLFAYSGSGCDVSHG